MSDRLLAEVRNGNIAGVKSLLKEGADVNGVDHDGKSPLMIAIQQGDVNVVKFLLKNGAKVDLQDNNGWSSLMSASQNGHVDTAKLLLKNGAKVDLQTEDGGSSLMLASQNGHVEAAKLLLKNGAKVDLQAEDGGSSLMRASHKGHVDAAKLLLKNGAEVDLLTGDGWSSLMLAIQNGHVEAAKLLLKNGAKVDLHTENGGSSLMYASQNGHVEAVKLLLENGATVDLQTEDGWSSLMLASQNGHVDAAKLLLENGAKVDLQRKDGQSSLMSASLNCHINAAKLLLENGAKVDLQSNDGRSSLMWANQNGHIDAAKLLLENGAKVDLQANDGGSSLMFASRNGLVDVVKLLLYNDADIYLKNDDGQTALDIADDPRIISLFSQLRTKDSLPGVSLSEGVTRKTVTSVESCVDRLKESGFSLSFPKDFLPSSDPPLEVSIQPCFKGPFELPDDIASVSPAYVLKPSRKVDFIKDFSLKIRHYANLQTDEDCKDMVFLTASSSPEYRGSNPVYVFKEMTGVKVSFKPNGDEPVGEIPLRHFSVPMVGKRNQSNVQLLYSTRFYQTKKRAIFCVCLFQPLFIEHCGKVIASNYSSESMETVKNAVCITSTNVGIKEEESCEWEVHSDKTPPKISKREIESQLEYQIEELLKMDFPPRIVMTCTPQTPRPKPLELNVEGFNEKYAFIIKPGDFLYHTEMDSIHETAPMMDSMEELRKEIDLQSKNAVTTAILQMMELVNSLQHILKSENPAIASILADMNGKCQILLDSAKQEVKQLKNTYDMETHIEAVITYTTKFIIYGANLIYLQGNINEWRYATSLIITNAANLMNSIRKVLQSSRMAHALPHNYIPSKTTPPPTSPLSPFTSSICSDGLHHKSTPPVAPKPKTVYNSSPKKEFKVKEIFLCLYPLRARWQTIGTLLDMDDGTLASIKADNASVEDQLREMITTWLKQVTPPPTWNTLADAVEVIDPNKAQEIRKHGL